MPKITILDKTSIQTISSEISLALKAIENRYGIVLKTGGCRFTDSAAKMSLEISTVGTSGEVIDLESAFLRANLRFFGFTEDSLKKPIRLGSKSFTLHGYKKARYAKPFSLKCLEDGKIYVATRNQVNTAFGLPLQHC